MDEGRKIERRKGKENTEKIKIKERKGKGKNHVFPLIFIFLPTYFLGISKILICCLLSMTNVSVSHNRNLCKEVFFLVVTEYT